MIDFQLTDDHDALVQLCASLRRKKSRPTSKSGTRSRSAPRIFKKMAELNLLGVCIPEQYGGAGFDYIRSAWFVKNWKRLTRSCASRCRCTRA